MKNFKRKLKGYSLAELVLAIGIFATISSMLVLLVVDSTRTFENINTRSKATILTQEINRALMMLKSESWYNIAGQTNLGPKHLEYVSGQYNISDGEITENGLTYSFTISEIERDTNGLIIESGGNLDPHSRLITLNISWQDRFGQVHQITPKMYVNDWNTHSIVWTTRSEFDTGNFAGTMSQELQGGEVRLLSMTYGDWCNPTLSMSTHNLTRSGIPTTLFTINDYVYMGTGGNASGDAFAKVSVVGEPPVLTELGKYNGYKVYDVYGLNGYAILGTDSPSKELVILDISSPANIYTEFTYLDISPNPKTKQKYVFVNGEKGYLTNDNNITVFSINNLQQNVQPTVLKKITIGDANSTITDIHVDSEYIYASLKDSTNDFYIIQNTSPYNILGQTNLGAMNVTSFFISEDKTRAYIGTQNNTGNEFFILNITNKTGPYSIVNSLDLGGISVSAIVSADERVMIGGIGGQEYLVYNIENELSPFRCGGLDIDAGINMIGLVEKGNNVYTYVLTGDALKELQIIKGGPGGGGPNGEGYLANGLYLSEIYDSSSTTSEYYILGLKTTIPNNTSLSIQLRSSNDPSMSGSIWMGPDGTSGSSYGNSGTYSLPSSLTGRYLQYRVEFNSDTVYTPLLEELVINYEK